MYVHLFPIRGLSLYAPAHSLCPCLYVRFPGSFTPRQFLFANLSCARFLKLKNEFKSDLGLHHLPDTAVAGYTLDLDWIWNVSGLHVDWICIGFGLDLDWIWTGSGLDLDRTWIRSWSDLDWIWIGSGSGLDLDSIWFLFLDLTWIRSGLEMS